MAYTRPVPLAATDSRPASVRDSLRTSRGPCCGAAGTVSYLRVQNITVIYDPDENIWGPVATPSDTPSAEPFDLECPPVTARRADVQVTATRLQAG